MKFLIIILIFTWLVIHFYVPSEIKNKYIEKIWLQDYIHYDVKTESDKYQSWIIDLTFKNDNAEFSWDISFWKIYDMNWALGNYVNCFKSDNLKMFTLNQVLHRIILEKDKNISIKLIPEDSEDNLSIYAYKVKPWLNVLPPEITMTHKCLSAYNAWEKDIEMEGDTIRSEVVIWVSWKENTTNWKYKLILEQLK
jgi:hypothetical protein